MKKILILAMGAILALASCSTDEQPAGRTVEATFAVSLPDASRATVSAFGNGEKMATLFYAVYTTDGASLVASNTTGLPMSGTSADVTISLVDGNRYKVIFWAQAADAPYTLDLRPQAKTMTVDYGATNDALPNNNESLDAFYVCREVKIDSDNKTLTLSLQRPFAQLNLATLDKADAAASSAWPTASAVTLTHVPNVLNLWTGTVSGDATVTFSAAALPNTDGTPEQLSIDGTAYDYLAMTYVLAPSDVSLISDITLSLTSSTSLSRTYKNIPLRANYRTNVLGNLITTSSRFELSIYKAFDPSSN